MGRGFADCCHDDDGYDDGYGGGAFGVARFFSLLTSGLGRHLGRFFSLEQRLARGLVQEVA